MGNKITFRKLLTTTSSVTLTEQTFKRLSAKTGFTYGQVEQLHERFSELSENTEEICLKDLQKLNAINDNPLGDRICEVFISYAEQKHKMDFEKFVQTMAKFRTTSGDSNNKREVKRREKLEFVFKIYDIDSNGFITHNELYEILRKMIGKTTTDQQIQQMADQVITEMDLDADNQISFKDYCDSLISDDIETKVSLPFLKRRD